MKITTGQLPKIEDREVVRYIPAYQYEAPGYRLILKEIEIQESIPDQAERVAVKTGASTWTVTWTWVETVLDSATILTAVKPVTDCKHVRERVSSLQIEQAAEGLSIKDEVARFYQVPAEAVFQQISSGVPGSVDYRWDWYELEFLNEKV